MARRSSFFDDFERGFNATGRILSQYESGKLAREKVEDVDRGLNLKSDGEQAAMLNAQNEVFGDDAAAAGRSTAQGLKTVDPNVDPSKVGQQGYRYLDKTYGEKPEQGEMDFQRGLKTADIYQKYGQNDDAMRFRNDAYQGRNNEMQYRGLKRQDDQQQRLADLSNQFEAARNGDPEAIKALMRGAMPVYNGSEVTDDDNMAEDVDGQIMIKSPDGQSFSAMEYMAKLPPAEQRKMLMDAYQYARSGITGDFSALQNQMNSDRNFDYTKGRAEVSDEQWRTTNNQNQRNSDRSYGLQQDQFTAGREDAARSDARWGATFGQNVDHQNRTHGLNVDKHNDDMTMRLGAQQLEANKQEMQAGESEARSAYYAAQVDKIARDAQKGRAPEEWETRLQILRNPNSTAEELSWALSNKVENMQPDQAAEYIKSWKNGIVGERSTTNPAPALDVNGVETAGGGGPTVRQGTGESVMKFVEAPQSAEQAIRLLEDGTVANWKQRGLDVQEWMDIARSIAGAKERRIIQQYMGGR